jgi:hypothetical protein
VKLFTSYAYAEKAPQAKAFPKLEADLVRIVKSDLNCLGLMVGKNKVLADAHCVTKEITSKDPAAQVTIQPFPFGTKTYTVEAAQISIHPNYVPGEADGKFQQRTGFDIAMLEINEDLPTRHFPLRRSIKNLTQELRQNACGIVVFRGLRPIFVPVFLSTTASAVNAVTLAAFASVFTGTIHRAPSDFDTIEGITVAELYPGDSGAPVICRNASNKLALVALLRGGGDQSHVILQDLYFDDWVTERQN